MLYIAICDDEKIICDQVERFVVSCAEKVSLAVKTELFYNGEDLYELLVVGRRFDLIFLDIELCSMNGVAVGRAIRFDFDDHQTQIVYISAQNRYAMELFSVHPLDFLVKPITKQQVETCMKTALKLKKDSSEMYCYRQNGVDKNLYISDIFYFQSDARKILIVHRDGKDEFYGKLNDLAADWPDDSFLRIHQSYFVNFHQIKAVRASQVVMFNGDILPVSRGMQKEVALKLGKQKSGCG